MNVYNDTVKRKGKWQIDLLPSASISITADVDRSFIVITASLMSWQV